MLESILISCLIFFTGYYMYFLLRVQVGISRLKMQPLQTHQPFVSIVIAARNEERSISNLLTSLLQQSYSSENYEIILVDDASTDRTSSIVQQFQTQHKSLVLLHTKESSQKTTGRKAAALTQGIQFAKGEIIATTDADCVVPSRWIETLVQYFSIETAMVAGPVAEKASASVFGNLESLEFLGLIAVGAGLIGSRRPIICNGANLAYRKSAFEKVHGFGDGTNDDEALMNRIVYNHVGTIAFAASPEALVTTASENTMKTFFLQRIRWANKRGHYEDPAILFSLVGLYLFFVFIAAVWIMAVCNRILFYPALIALAVKVIIDYSTLRAGAKQWNQRVPLPYFLIAEVFHVPYILLAAAVGQISTLTWKGQKIA
jgi:cellulose synthase/poly-beta-1,6-N-acetylglucosamine synthase-like glycosyltransferase